MHRYGSVVGHLHTARVVITETDSVVPGDGIVNIVGITCGPHGVGGDRRRQRLLTLSHGGRGCFLYCDVGVLHLPRRSSIVGTRSRIGLSKRHGSEPVREMRGSIVRSQLLPMDVGNQGSKLMMIEVDTQLFYLYARMPESLFNPRSTILFSKGRHEVHTLVVFFSKMILVFFL